MKNKNDKTVDLLIGLIEINTDRIEGYEKAAKGVKSKEFETLFSGLANESRKNRSELISKVVSNGGTPKEGSTLSGKFYYPWMDVNTALSNDLIEIIISCESGEDAALQAYDEVLSNERLEEHSRKVINMQKSIIQKSYDHIKVLHDGMNEPHRL